MESAPRYLGLSIADGEKPVFHVAVRSRNVPGALGDITTRLGKAGLNIITLSDCSNPESDDSAVSFFVEPKGVDSSEDEIRRTLSTSHYVTEVLVRKSDGKLMIDDFGFPLVYFPSGRAVLLSQNGIHAMFRDIVRMFGTGGESILFRAGHSVGTQSINDVAKVVGEEYLRTKTETLAGFYSALGWGKLELIEASEDMVTYKLKLSMGLECEEGAPKPSCHFTRGMIAGATERIFGGPAKCAEERCASMGDPFCVFVVTRREAD